MQTTAEPRGDIYLIYSYDASYFLYFNWSDFCKSCILILLSKVLFIVQIKNNQSRQRSFGIFLVTVCGLYPLHLRDLVWSSYLSVIGQKILLLNGRCFYCCIVNYCLQQLCLFPCCIIISSNLCSTQELFIQRCQCSIDHCH